MNEDKIGGLEKAMDSIELSEYALWDVPFDKANFFSYYVSRFERGFPKSYSGIMWHYAKTLAMFPLHLAGYGFAKGLSKIDFPVYD